MKNKTILPTAAAILTNVIFGFSFLFSTVALRHAHPLLILQIRFTVAFAVLNLLWLLGIVKLDFKGFRPSMTIIKQIYSVGIPSIIMQSIGSVMVFCMNQILIAFSTTATAVFGVYFKLQSFIFMPIFGMNNGVVPIVAYNYGAQKKERLVKAVKLSMLYAVGIMCIGVLLFQLIPDKLFMMFDASEQMLAMGAPALRIISLHLPLAGVCIIGGTMFQALGHAVYSMITSICRQLVVLLPSAWLLSRLGNVNLVWWAFPIAEVASLTITIIFIIKINRDVISKIGMKEA